MNAICCPFGDQAPRSLEPAPRVNWVTSEPLAFIVYSCVVPPPERELVKRMSPLDGSCRGEAKAPGAIVPDGTAMFPRAIAVDAERGSVQSMSATRRRRTELTALLLGVAERSPILDPAMAVLAV